MKVTHLDHLVLTTARLDACLHFYVDLLGMEADEQGGRWAVKFGHQKLNIHRRPGEFLPAARYPHPGSLDLCLIVEGPIEAVAAELAAKGLVPELGVVTRTGANGPIDSIYLRDPDGNLVELSVYHTF